MTTVAMTGLVQIDLPERTLRFSDGGFFPFNGGTFEAEDAAFGTIGEVSALTEGVGDTVPALTLTMLPPDGTAVADLSKPGHQQSVVRFWLAEYDVATQAILSVDLQFVGQIDQSVLELSRDGRRLTISVVSLAERLFEGNIGNTLNPSWHKSVWPGEQGHDNATGLGIPVAWGTERPRGGASGGGYGTAPGGFPMPNIRQY